MKLKTIAAAHTGILLAMIAVPAAAQDTSGTNALEKAIGSPDDFTLSGSFRARIEGIDGQFRPTAAQDDQLLSLRTTLFGEYHPRSEEHTSELQSLMRISYAVFCLKKKNIELYR